MVERRNFINFFGKKSQKIGIINVEGKKIMSWDAIQFCRDNSVEYWLSGKNVQEGWVNINCPLCDDESNHGGFNSVVGYYHCWRCGGHKIVPVIKSLLPVSWDTASKMFLDYTGRIQIINKISRKKPKGKKIEIPGEELAKMHKKYLSSRGFEPEYFEKKYNLKGTSTAGEFKYRIIIPIYYDGKLVTFQGRDVTDKQQLRYKALSTEKSLIDYREIFYEFDNVGQKTIGLVEGCFDQWRLGDGFVASFGTSLTEQQIRLLCDFDRVFILFDPEFEAQSRAKEIANKISSIGINAEIIDIEIDGDPADLSDDEAKYIRRELGFEKK